ncbi:methyltransferase domain-containing protein [Ensifer sp. ENS02]|uniref:methyltransferase domain-containing protein n=1 Tax=Ensifer sp. ENS02 TaxID=2769290 RepID=UPI0013AF0059|nr:methyltransferase domain-containing protein [Ensifer sp. ENS02]MBD9520730.1 methyltransferase domain-containing protein [Ensifer sp. ENS02]
MHDTALSTGALFFASYANDNWTTVVETGSLDVNGSLRTVAPAGLFYVGVDTEFGKSVDVKVCIGDPLPFRDEYADCIVSSSQMEHDDFFWMTFLDMLRVVKTGGYIYINAPSNGAYHRYPNDNWRFYPDCGNVLVKWARRNGFAVELVESFVSDRTGDIWNDFVAVFVKGSLNNPPTTYIADQIKSRNVWKWHAEAPDHFTPVVEDLSIQRHQAEQIKQLRAQIEDMAQERVSHSDPVVVIEQAS